MTAPHPTADMRCGDHVLHHPSGETWVVAYVDGDYLAWCGWPEGQAKVADCTLVKSCSDEEHIALLNRIAQSDAGRRTRMARRALGWDDHSPSPAPRQAETE